MPIRPENKERYPVNWAEIADRIKKRARHKCERCGVRNYELGGRDPDGNWHAANPTGTNGMSKTWPLPGDYGWCRDWPHEQLRIVRIILTVAHLNHTPENCSPDNLRAWCQRCHNSYDAGERRKGTEQRARAERAVGDLFEGGA